MSLGTVAGALAQLLLVAAIGWIVGDLLLRRSLNPAAALPDGFGLPERALGAVIGFVFFCVAMMVAHIVTGGAVFGLPGLVPLIGAGVLVSGLRRRLWPRHVPWRFVVPAIAVLAALYIAPAVASGSGVRTGDSSWHLGWTEQLLAGEPVPVGPAPEYAHNSYPWGWHAMLATTVRLVPGTDPLVALEAMHAVLVLALPLGAACLARRVNARAGWAAAAAAGLIGGWGWLMLSEPDFVFSPDGARYGADLVVASPNSVYALFPPALPREFGLLLLAGAGVLIAVALRASDRGLRVVAGAAIGMVGLVSVPLFFSALLWTFATSLSLPRGSRFKALGSLLGPAIVVFALWAGPVVRDAVRFGGLLNITPELGVERPLISSLGSWGLLLPAAVIGLGVVARTRIQERRTLLAFATASATVLALAFARAEFDWGLAGNASILHQGRAWPPAHLLAAAFAGVAATHAYGRVRGRVRTIAAGAGLVVLAIGAISPVMASVRFHEVLGDDTSGYVYASEDLASGSFVRQAAEQLDSDDVVEVEGSDELAWFVFQLSGARLAGYDDPRLEQNDLRIRFAEPAGDWDARMDNGGFEADYVVIPGEDVGSSAPIATGEYAGETWALILSRKSDI